MKPASGNTFLAVYFALSTSERSALQSCRLKFFYALKHPETDWNFYLKPYVQNFQNGVCAHYVMLSKIRWKPFWLFYPAPIRLSTEWLDRVAKWCELWQMGTGPIVVFVCFVCLCLNVFCRQLICSLEEQQHLITLLWLLSFTFLFERAILLPFQEHEGQQLDSRQACPSVPLGEEEPNEGKMQHEESHGDTLFFTKK